MQLTTPYQPIPTGNLAQDLKNLTKHVGNLIEDLQIVLNNLDAGNVLEAGSVKAQNIDTAGAKIANAQIQALKAGKIWGELIAGKKMQISNEGGNFSLDGSGMVMENENGTFAITPDGVRVNGLDLVIERTVATTPQTVKTRVILQNYIAGGSGAPSINQPILIQKKVGAGAWKDIFSIDAGGNVFMQGSLATGESGEARTVIDDNGIESYDDSNRKAGLFANDKNSVGARFSDLTLYYQDEPLFQVFNDAGSVVLKAYDLALLRTTGSATRPLRAWDFSDATAVNGLNTDSAGNHNHGIPHGTKLAVTDGSGAVTGYMEFSSSGAHYHDVKKA